MATLNSTCVVACRWQCDWATRPSQPLASAFCLKFPANCIFFHECNVYPFPPNTFGVSFVAFFVFL